MGEVNFVFTKDVWIWLTDLKIIWKNLYLIFQIYFVFFICLCLNIVCLFIEFVLCFCLFLIHFIISFSFDSLFKFFCSFEYAYSCFLFQFLNNDCIHTFFSIAILTKKARKKRITQSTQSQKTNITVCFCFIWLSFSLFWPAFHVWELKNLSNNCKVSSKSGAMKSISLKIL